MLSRVAVQSCRQIGRDLRKCAVTASPAVVWTRTGTMALSRSQSQLSPAMYTTVHSMSTKKVHRYSWAADRLEQLGEQIIEPEKRDLVEVTDELLHNPPDNIKKMGEEIIDLNLLEINQLINLIQKRLQLSDEMVAAALSGGGGGGGGEAAAPVEAEKPKEKDTFSIKISAPVDQKAKIKIIKEVRAITGLGLKEAKELVEKAPVVLKENLKKEEAENLKKLLVDSGAQIELI